jgi:parallel beta-helix repeat protein
MKKLALLTILALSFNFNTDWFDLFRADYFFSSANGVGGNSGTLPWNALPIDSINSITFSPGDRIGIEGEWTGTITVGQSGTAGNPITYKGYGNGATIYGSEVITGWTLRNAGDSIWVAKANATAISAVYINDERLQSARIPKTGYYDVTSYVSTTQFRSNQIPDEADGFYIGAVAVMRNARYAMETKAITASVDSLLTISGANTNGALGVGEGFFLTNKFEFLTKPNEWYYDAVTDSLYIKKADGIQPTDTEIRASTYDKVFDLTGVDYVTLKNLTINHGNYGAYFSSTSDHNTIDNCVLNNQDLVSIGSNASGYTYPTITNNTITGANGSAIRAKASNGTINGNTISNTGLFANIQKATLQTADKPVGTAIYTRLDNNTINYNTITNSGYNGIEFQGLNTLVQYNYVNGACQVLDDGGGIYCTSWATGNGKENVTVGSIIDRNTVVNVYGNTDGTGTIYGAAAGIYVDFEAWGVGITNNTISGTTQGFYVNSGKDNYFRNNTVYDAMLGIYFKALSDYISYENILFRSNNLYQTDRLGYHTWSGVLTHQKLQWPITTGDYFLNDSNTYVAPFTKTTIFKGSTDFADWQTDTGTDANSDYDGTNAPAWIGKDTIIYNETATAKTIAGITGADSIRYAFTGDDVTFPLSLQPYTSEVITYQDTTISIDTLGNTDLTGYVVNSTNTRRAIPVTATKDGSIVSITIYHSGHAASNILMAVYSDSSDLPNELLGVTTATAVNTTEGWQEIVLNEPVSVTQGQKVWLAFVSSSIVEYRYKIGVTAGRVTSTYVYADGMADPWGTATVSNNASLMYCTILTEK